jgi:hypothetical protein
MDVPETRYAKSGNVHVAYCIHGDGSVDLVYIPGWISNIELLWEGRWMRAWLDCQSVSACPGGVSGCRISQGRISQGP